MQNFGQFCTTSDLNREYLRNEATSKIGKTYDLGKFLVCLTKKSGERCSTNYLELHVSLDPLKCTFWGNYISAYSACCALKFLHALEIDQGLLAHTPRGTWFPLPKKLIVKI